MFMKEALVQCPTQKVNQFLKAGRPGDQFPGNHAGMTVRFQFKRLNIQDCLNPEIYIHLNSLNLYSMYRSRHIVPWKPAVKYSRCARSRNELRIKVFGLEAHPEAPLFISRWPITWCDDHLRKLFGE